MIGQPYSGKLNVRLDEGREDAVRSWPCRLPPTLHTIIVCDSYEKADHCAKLLLEHGDRSGAHINFSKSSGISILTPDPVPEIRSKNSITFLGHSLSAQGVRISDKSIARIKRRVSTILYNHLLLQPKRKQINPVRVGAGFVDWDLVTCVNELRRYVYGRIGEEFLGKALDGGPVNLTRCAMSFYPTVDFAASDQLRALDGWLADVVYRAHRKRAQLLAGVGVALSPVAKDQVISGAWYEFPAIKNDARLPSFYKSWAYVRKCAKVFGLTRFPAPLYGYF